MALTIEQRQEIYSKFSRLESTNRTPINALKSEGKLAVDEIDDWIDAYQASFLGSVTAGISNKQKLKIFLEIINTRWRLM